MNPKTASTLVWASVITSLLGMIILSPAAGFVLYVVAMLLSLAPLVSGPKMTRIAAVAVIMISFSFAYHGYPAFEKEREAYRKRAEAVSIKAPVTVQPQEKK